MFTTGRDAEQLLVSRKELFDSPVPSANANAAYALLRAAAIHGRSDLAQRAEQILRLIGGAMASQPLAHSRLLAAFDLAVGSTSEIVIAGQRPDLLAEVRGRYLPNTVVVHGEAFDSPLWEGRTGDQAYLCEGYTCQVPTGDPMLLATQLEGLGRAD